MKVHKYIFQIIIFILIIFTICDKCIYAGNRNFFNENCFIFSKPYTHIDGINKSSISKIKDILEKYLKRKLISISISKEFLTGLTVYNNNFIRKPFEQKNFISVLKDCFAIYYEYTSYLSPTNFTYLYFIPLDGDNKIYVCSTAFGGGYHSHYCTDIILENKQQIDIKNKILEILREDLAQILR